MARRQLSRRNFLKTGALSAAAISASAVLPRQLFASAAASELIFRPFPHPQAPKPDFVYAADAKVDPFKSSLHVTNDGIVAPANIGKPFSVNARWYVEGFGYVWLAADNAGELYRVDQASKDDLNLNYEFARSRVARNESVKRRYESEGASFSAEVRHLHDMSRELLDEARRELRQGGEKAARSADRSLMHALWCGEKIEMEKARYDIARTKRNEKAWFGCETRQFVWAKSEEFEKRFTELFNFATITHYVWDSWYELFEPREGVYNWGIKDDILHWLMENKITPQGRPLFWFHPTVTPDWLKNKSFEELKKYVEIHTKDLVGHYGDRVTQWEVVNEYHDLANIHNHTPEQIEQIVRLACETTKAANPKVVKILNNCCPWAEYVARGRMARMDATRPLRSPRQFLKDTIDAGIDFDVLGIQIYFPQRDFSDIARLLERLAALGKPMYITEFGASSDLHPQSAPGSAAAPQTTDPYSWHRHWDEELQADWLEDAYTLFYSKPYIKAINWYDCSDFRPFIQNGGLIREDSSPKQSFFRLKKLLEAWG